METLNDLSKEQKQFLNRVAEDVKQFIRENPEFNRAEIEMNLDSFLKRRLESEEQFFAWLLSDDPEALKVRDQLAEETYELARKEIGGNG